MIITNRLVATDHSLCIHNEGEWSKTHSKFSAFNDAGVECEVGEFLYAMVRLLKPQNILETGTHHGIGASYMAMAAKDNGFGKVTTIEFIPEICAVARERFKKLELTGHIESILGRVEDYTPPQNFQLILLDTEPITRFAELVKFYERLDAGGFIFIHDTPRNLCQGNVNSDHPEIASWPFGNVPHRMKELVRAGELRPVHFPTPRGFIGFYKVHPDDLKW